MNRSVPANPVSDANVAGAMSVASPKNAPAAISSHSNGLKIRSELTGLPSLAECTDRAGSEITP